MKKIFYLVAIATTMMFTACSSNEKTDWDKYELKGKVKELTIEYYTPSIYGPDKMEISMAEEISFDKDGRVTQRSEFGRNRMPYGSYEYTYEKEDNVKRTKIYRAEHDYKVIENTYEDDRITETREYFCDKLVTVVKDIEYNEEGLVTKESVYDADGKLWNTNEYEYDEQGHETKFIVRSSTGRTEIERTTTYNEDGFKASEKEGVYNTEYTYDEFDKKGNFISRKIKDEGRRTETIEKRTIVYY